MELSDAARDRAVRDLTRFCGDGRLTLDELEERIAEVYAASSIAEIEHALREMPKSSPAVVPPPVASTPRPTRSPAPMTKTDVDARRGGEIALRIHLVVYLSVIAMLTAIWFLTSPFGYYWPIWTAMPWGMAVAIHAGVHKAVWQGRDT